MHVGVVGVIGGVGLLVVVAVVILVGSFRPRGLVFGLGFFGGVVLFGLFYAHAEEFGCEEHLVCWLVVVPGGFVELVGCW